MSAFDVIIYHNPACGTSRNALAMIRNAGIEPHVVEYLKMPPTRAMLENICARGGLNIRDILRKKAPPFAELGLDNPSLSDGDIFAAIDRHPALIERPIVVSPMGVRLCRPAEKVLEILPARRGEFFDESGERKLDENGRPVRSA
jgi:arsenate reductase